MWIELLWAGAEPIHGTTQRPSSNIKNHKILTQKHTTKWLTIMAALNKTFNKCSVFCSSLKRSFTHIPKCPFLCLWRDCHQYTQNIDQHSGDIKPAWKSKLHNNKMYGSDVFHGPICFSSLQVIILKSPLFIKAEYPLNAECLKF